MSTFVKMGNCSKTEVLRINTASICDTNNQTIDLKKTRIVKNIATNIILLLQLVNEGWKMETIKDMERNLSLYAKGNLV